MLTSYQKQRILFHRSKGLKPPTIARLLLEEENIRVSRISVYKFLRRYRPLAADVIRRARDIVRHIGVPSVNIQNHNYCVNIHAV